MAAKSKAMSKPKAVRTKAAAPAKPAPADGARYWLIKSEPEVFSIVDLEAAPNKTTCWDGVRNYQARNTLRDEMQVGDLALFYHSNAEPPAAAGIVEVSRTGYPDPTAFDPDDHHYDPKSRPDAPTWYMVDVRHVRTFAEPVTLTRIKADKRLAGMALLTSHRLSVQPVTPAEWKAILELADSTPG